jgi:chromosome segregation ATPase
MEQVTKLTEQEIQQLTQLQTQQEEFVAKFGQLEYQLQNLELQKEKLIEQLEQSKEAETQVANQLNEKYGDGVINLQEGTFSKQ